MLQQQYDVGGSWQRLVTVTCRKATPNRSTRITRIDGRTSVDALFHARGEARSQVSLQHSKLEHAERAAEVKACRAERVAELERLLAG